MRPRPGHDGTDNGGSQVNIHVGRVAGIVGAFIALLNVVLTIGGVPLDPFV